MSRSVQTDEMNEAFPTWDVLLKIGFQEKANVLSTGGLGLIYKRGGLELDAIRCMGRYFFEVILITGIFRDERSLAEINSELPLGFKSERQAQAVLAYNLSDYFTTPLPQWLEQGLADEDLLPWEEEAAEQRPIAQCWIDRDFARILRKRLRDFCEASTEKELIEFDFDGSCLKVGLSKKPLVLQAEGEPWPVSYRIAAKAMQQLPARFSRSTVGMYVWDEVFGFENCRYPLYQPEVEQLTMGDINGEDDE